MLHTKHIYPNQKKKQMKIWMISFSSTKRNSNNLRFNDLFLTKNKKKNTENTQLDFIVQAIICLNHIVKLLHL